MHRPLVSIIIPVYNGENYLEEAIQSALNQTYPNIEVIVINDGSCDNGATERIAQAYGDKIRYFYKENGGVATALNLGIQKMKGDYFSWLSHDDLYYPNKIEKQIQVLSSKGSMTTIIHSDYDLLNVNSQMTTRVQKSNLYSKQQLTNSVFPILQGLIHGCDLLIHKSHFERVGIFDESLRSTQDYDLWFRMFRYQKTIYVNESFVLSRIHDAQGSRTMDCFDSERCRLYLNYIKALNEEEIRSMYGNLYHFYHKMSCFFKGGRMEEAYQYVNQKFQKTDIPENLSKQLSDLARYIKGLSDGKAERICIFCAGDYGIRLYQELRSKLISVNCFSDNNPKKWGYLFDNVYCIDPKKLLKDKERTLVIVATRTPDEIVKQLKSEEFPYVTTKQDIERILFSTPPVKWITALESLENIDYSSKDVLLLINKFNEVIFDICKYYEDKNGN